MEPIKDHDEFKSLMKYAFAIKLFGPRSLEEVPTVGIVFGNHEIPSRCHVYMCRSYEGNRMKIYITRDYTIAKIELLESSDGNKIFSLELNYDQNELMDFKDKTPSDSKVALVFGFNHGCDYYITGNAGDKSQNFSPIVLDGYNINL